MVGGAIPRRKFILMFAEYLARWGVTPDGDPTLTRNSRLLPVRWRGASAMLKVALEAEGKAGNGLMAWWGGEGAASWPMTVMRSY